MKRILLFLIILTSYMVQAQEKLIMNDPMAVLRDVGSFESIEVRGPFKVYYSVGNHCSVAVSARSESARDRIQVKKSGNLLIIDLETSYRNWIPGDDHFRIYVSSPTVKNISASGAVDFLVTDLIKSDDLKIQFSGASDFLGKLDCKALQLHFTGASDIELTGNAKSLRGVFTGASKLKASTLQVEDADLKASGASHVYLSVSQKLHANSTGASDIVYYGNPSVLEVNSSGASKIKRGN